MQKTLLHFILILIAVATITPIWIMFITSFKSVNSQIGLNAVFFNFSDLTLNNFYDVWIDGKFNRYFLNSVIVTFFITLANVIFDSMTAYALARKKFIGQKILMGLIILKLMIPATVLIVPTFILIQKLNLYDTYLALILPLIAETFGIFLLRQYMLAFPPSLEEAAKIEGASDLRIFLTIIFPLTKPALSIVIIHSVMTSWNMYIYPLILTSSDHMRTLPLGIAFYRASNTGIDAGHLMAGSVISALPIMILFILFQRHIISGLTAGAVKG